MRRQRFAQPSPPRQPSAAEQAEAVILYLEATATRHHTACDQFKRGGDEEAAGIEADCAEALHAAARVLRQHRLLPPSAAHKAAQRVAAGLPAGRQP